MSHENEYFWFRDYEDVETEGLEYDFKEIFHLCNLAYVKYAPSNEYAPAAIILNSVCENCEIIAGDYGEHGNFEIMRKNDHGLFVVPSLNEIEKYGCKDCFDIWNNQIESNRRI